MNNPSTKEGNTEKASSKIRNGIQLKVNGLTVEQAFLTYEDGALVSNENKIDAVITRLDELYDHFLVEFRVWDKKGGADVTGSYKLYLK